MIRMFLGFSFCRVWLILIILVGCFVFNLVRVLVFGRLGVIKVVSGKSFFLMVVIVLLVNSLVLFLVIMIGLMVRGLKLYCFKLCMIV